MPSGEQMLSVIIPSYNSEQTIAQCLASLHRQTYSGPYEIILVDSSDDATPRLVTASYPSVTLISLKEKTDPGTARNRGIAAAHGDILAFIDADCIAAPDWLEKIAAAHRAPYGAVGGSIHNAAGGGSLIAWAGYITEFREFLPEQPQREVFHIPTCNISYKKALFDRCGYFPGEYYPQEDLVFHYRAREKGETMLFDPSIHIYHHHRTLLSAYLVHQTRIGEATAGVLRITGLEGSFLLRHPVLALPVLPLLPLVKFIKTMGVFLRYQPGTILRHFPVVFVVALGLLFWLGGFIRGAYRSRPAAAPSSG